MDHRIVVKKLEILNSLMYDTSLPIEHWQGRTADNPSPGEYVFDNDWTDVTLPATFKAGKTVFLRATALVDTHSKLENTCLSFDMQSMEGLLRIDGVPYAGIDGGHKRVLAPYHGPLNIEIEYLSVLDLWCHPELADTWGVFTGGSVCVVNHEVEALCHDVKFAFGTVNTVSEPRRKQLLNDALEACLLAVDLTLPREQFLREVTNARAILAQKLAAIHPDPEAGSIYAVGHTHIDTAWLWPLKETVRKSGRTFSTACRLMEQYPDFYFACSQPQLYQYIKDYYPDIYTQIKKWVAAGQWDTTGAMWIEADCNATSGESLIRQILLGIGFFKTEFGTRPRICWLPDVFGYPASLPEILAGSGVPYFYTYKLHWQALNPFPKHVFHWRGLDGSEVLAAVVNNQVGYNGTPNPDELVVAWERHAQKVEHPEVLFPYGFGDGGGGVNEEMLEMRRRAEPQYPGLPAVRTGPAEGYFTSIIERGSQIPVWDGELYVETHRGTYTTQSALKKANRLSELLLRDAEIWGSLAHPAGRTFDRDVVQNAWKRVLLQQFHDILPGTSVPEVYVDAHNDHEAVRRSIEPQVDQALTALTPDSGSSAAIRVFNSLSWTRNDPSLVKVASTTGTVVLVGVDGIECVAQVVKHEPDGDVVVVEGLGIPSFGYADFEVVEKTAPESAIVVTTTGIETALLRLTITPDGALSRVYDKSAEREVIAPGKIGNDLQLLQDGPEFEDSWNMHDTLDKRRYAFAGETTIEVIETGPVRAIVRIKRIHRNTVVEQDIVVTANSRRIDFVTRVDWQERHTMIKVAFPLAIRSLHATYEVQFGAVERATHRNTTWETQKFEVPAQRWADLSEPGYGVSLLNDSRYGYDAKENVLRLSLLRSATWPDPEADRGTHEFTYSLLPHTGDWIEAETVRRAWELNVPVRTQPSGPIENPHSYLHLDGVPAIVETLKPAEDDRGLILRLYEPHGARGSVNITLDWPVEKIIECNHVEEDGDSIEVVDGRFQFQINPFQIRSFRLM